MKKWSEIKHKGSVTPEMGAKIAKEVRAEIEAMNLAQLRKAAKLTQAQMATKLKTAQARMSKIEKVGGDPKLSTLRSYVHALGGEFKVSAVIKGKTVDLVI
jgi:DNA-binding XRE family transcriptional regulator